MGKEREEQKTADVNGKARFALLDGPAGVIRWLITRIVSHCE